MGIRPPQNNCEVQRHEATIEISQSGGTSFTYFTDLTENHYKALIEVEVTGAAPDACWPPYYSAILSITSIKTTREVDY